MTRSGRVLPGAYPRAASRRRLGAPSPTLADVADLAGVSRQTVSNAINNPALLREDTLARVRGAVSALAYSPNRAARNLRTRSSHLVGMRFAPWEEGTANATIDRFVHALVQRTSAAGYHLLLFPGQAADPVAGYEELLRSLTVDAFVATDTWLGNPQAAWLEEHEAPFVAFGRPWENPDARHAWVDVDGAAGTQLATQHLLDAGHTRIAWIGWRRENWVGEDRRSGWSEAMHDAGLSTSGLASRVEELVGSGRDAAAALLGEASPTAFVCASDTLAAGVLHALAERGLEPGRDVSVVGFDDSQVAQLLPGGLTSLRQPLEEVAGAVVDALEDLLAQPRRPRSGVLLQPTLAVRGSTGPAPAW